VRGGAKIKVVDDIGNSQPLRQFKIVFFLGLVGRGRRGTLGPVQSPGGL